MRVLVTGGAGFIGTNFVKFLLRETDWKVRVLDLLTYAGNLENFTPEERANPRFEFLRGDVRRREDMRRALQGCDAVVHMAAETHIDRSLALRADDFITTDVFGTYVLLEALREEPVERALILSTSEVYGEAQFVPMTEEHPLLPQSPYAGAKAGADRLAHAYARAFGLPIVILRPFNNYGPYQYPEKLIPLFVTNALQDLPLPLYGTGENTRDWLFVEDHCEALLAFLRAPLEKVRGQVFNLGTGREITARQVGEMILDLLGKPRALLRSVPDRPAHVRRLCASWEKAHKALGWSPRTPFEEGLERTVRWYKENESWWKAIVRKRKHWDPRKELQAYPFLSP